MNSRYPGCQSALKFLQLIEGMVLTVCLCAPLTAEIPADYAGTPWGGVPREIPGRIDFEDYDLGGLNVTWKTDNKAGVYGTLAANRENDGETEHPGLCITNFGESPNDHFADGSAYPSNEDPQGSIYIGAAHASDWVSVTVHILQTGTFWISSTVASDPQEISFNLAINGENRTGRIDIPGTGNYHLWAERRNFATIDLDSGLYVLTFTLEAPHFNYDYLTFSLDSGSVETSRNMGTQESLSPRLLIRSENRDRRRVSLLKLDPGLGGFSIFDPKGRRLPGFLSVP